MCRKFSTQQFRIASCNNNMQVCTKKPIYEHVPSFNILHLIKKDIVNVCSVYLINARQYGVEFFCFQMHQTVIIKVRITILHPIFKKNLMTQSRFTTSTNTYYYLRKGAVKFKKLLLISTDPFFWLVVINIFFLFCQHLQY